VQNSRVVLAVDGNSLVHRSFHAQAGTGLRAADGTPMWAVRGLLSQLVAAVERIDPDVVVVGFDDAASSRRRERWPQYKATRTEKLATLVDQLELAVQVLRGLGVPVVVPAGLEADDVLATVARLAAEAGGRTTIMTSDRDSFALIDERTSVLRIINGGVEASPVLTPSRLMTMLGIAPDRYRDYAALRGDPSDNLPGVRGIGPKTAAKLLCALGSARAAFDDLAAGGSLVEQAIGSGAAARLADPCARGAWELNCQVMHLHDDISLDLSGLGGLPLAENAVRSAFDLLQLPATTAKALRVLSRVDAGPSGHAGPSGSRTGVPPTETVAENWDPERPQFSSGRARYGRLVKPLPRKAASDQLALF